MNKIFLNALGYLLFLIIIVIIFHIIKYEIKKQNIKLKSNIDEKYLEYFYISFFAIISGILLMFGYMFFTPAFLNILSNRNLANVATSTAVISTSLLLSAYFQDILQELLNVKIKVDVYKNVVAYIIGRIILITGIHFIL